MRAGGKSYGKSASVRGMQFHTYSYFIGSVCMLGGGGVNETVRIRFMKFDVLISQAKLLFHNIGHCPITKTFSDVTVKESLMHNSHLKLLVI